MTKPPATFTIAIQTDKSTQDYRDIGRAVEEFGFDGVSAFGDLGYQPPIPALLAVAEATQHLRLGVACLNPSLLHPVEIAGQIAALDEASGGRAYLGLARGSWLGQIGIPTSGGLQRLRECIEVVHYLLAGRDDGYRGTQFTIDPGFKMRYPLPSRPIDILLGVWGPKGAALAAELAVEVKLGGCANPDMVQLMGSWLEAETRARGGDHQVDVVVGAVTVVDEDRAAARHRARTEVAMYLDVVAPLDRTVTLPAGLLPGMRERLAVGAHEEAGQLIPDDVLDRFCFSGTPDDVAAQAIALVKAGARRVEFGTPHGLTDLGGINLLGSQVLPAVRKSLIGVSV